MDSYRRLWLIPGIILPMWALFAGIAFYYAKQGNPSSEPVMVSASTQNEAKEGEALQDEKPLERPVSRKESAITNNPQSGNTDDDNVYSVDMDGLKINGRLSQGTKAANMTPTSLKKPFKSRQFSIESFHDAIQQEAFNDHSNDTSPSITYRVKLVEGKTYVIDMMTPDQAALDPFLRLLNSSGKELATDDDSGGGLNARILLRAPITGTYQIVATCFSGIGNGQFTVTVRETKN